MPYTRPGSRPRAPEHRDEEGEALSSLRVPAVYVPPKASTRHVAALLSAGYRVELAADFDRRRLPNQHLVGRSVLLRSTELADCSRVEQNDAEIPGQ